GENSQCNGAFRVEQRPPQEGPGRIDHFEHRAGGLVRVPAAQRIAKDPGVPGTHACGNVTGNTNASLPYHRGTRWRRGRRTAAARLAHDLEDCDFIPREPSVKQHGQVYACCALLSLTWRPEPVKRGAVSRDREGGDGMQDRLLRPIRFGEFLVEKQVLNDGQLLDALAEHWATGVRLGETITARGYLPREEVERYANEYENLNVVYV